MGAGQAGSGISFTFGLFVSSIISQMGWRQTYVAVAIVLTVVLIPLFLLFFRARPGDKGLVPYGVAEATITTDQPARGLSGNAVWTVHRAMKTYQLWLLLFNQSLFWGIGLYLVLGHQVKFAEDVGFSPTFAASVFALFGLAMTLGEFGGFIGDRFGRERGNTLASLAPVIAVSSLLLVKDTSQPWLFYVFALGSGFGGGLYLSTYYAALADIYHGKHFGAILGLSLAGFGVGGVIGPWLGGYIYDKTGSYTWAFILSLMSFVVACTAFWLAAPRNAANIRAKALGQIDN
jgi:MFS family permease